MLCEIITTMSNRHHFQQAKQDFFSEDDSIPLRKGTLAVYSTTIILSTLIHPQFTGVYITTLTSATDYRTASATVAYHCIYITINKTRTDNTINLNLKNLFHLAHKPCRVQIIVCFKVNETTEERQTLLSHHS